MICPVAAAPPEATALWFRGARWSYAQLDLEVRRWHGRLAATGARRVAVLSANSPGLVALIHAAARAGCELALLNTRLTAAELAGQLEQLRPVTPLASRALAHLLPGALLIEGAPLDQAREPALDQAREPALDQTREPALDAAWPGPPLQHAPIDPAAVHARIFTSGTTGRPRAVELTVAALQASACAVNQALAVTCSSRFLCTLPLFHVGGLGIVLRCALAGAALDLHEKFEARAAAAALGEATHASLVASTLARVLDEGARFPGAYALIGGGPIPPALLERARAAGLAAHETYGLTEAASSVTIDGLPVPGTQVRIEAGEIEVRGPTLMRGYLGEAPLTGWLRTGDLGELDARGRVTVHARRSDLILSGGENVYPAEVEAALLAHPGVLEAAVLPAPDARWGQVGVAAVVLRSNATEVAIAGSGGSDAPALDQLQPGLREFLAPRLARYKLPQRFVALAALPHTALGKIDRPALRALLGLQG